MSEWKAILDALESGDEKTVRRLAADMHPADAAAVFEGLTDEHRSRFAEFLRSDALKLIVTFLPPVEAADLLGNLPQSDNQEVLNQLPDDVLVDVLQEMEGADRQRHFLLLSDEKKALARKLLAFPEDSAGGRMTTAMATLQEDMTIREAIDKLGAKREETEILARIYVVDNEGRILGKVRLRDLTFNPRSMLVSDIMDDERLAITANADQEEAVHMMSKYDMLALPVLNDEGKLLGVITHDDALEIQEEESTEDIEKMGAIGGTRDEEGYLRSSVGAHFRRRFAWIFGLAVIGILSGIILYSYEDLLAGKFLLAVFVPMIVATGGNTGAQSATMVIRAMSLGEFTPAAFLHVIWKELRIGLILGGIVGGLIAISSFFAIKLLGIDVPASIALGPFALTVGLALTAQVAASTLIGAALPIIARAVRLDPAVVASPAITTVVDIIGLLIYFSLAYHLLGLGAHA